MDGRNGFSPPCPRPLHDQPWGSDYLHGSSGPSGLGTSETPTCSNGGSMQLDPKRNGRWATELEW